MSKDSTASGGIGFGGLLTVLFIGLKLADVITWSWWWVLSPLLIPIALYLIFIIFCLIMALIAYIMARK